MRFEQGKNIEVAPMQGEVVLFNPGNNKFCLLNPTAVLVWNALQNPSSLDDVTAAVCNHFADADRARAQSDVETVLREMQSNEFVVSTQ